MNTSSPTVTEEIKKFARQSDAPFYIYDLQAITKKCEALFASIPDDMDVFYSLKANSNPELLRHLAHLSHHSLSHRLKVDVASAGELKSALEAGFTGRDIEFTGPGKTRAELALAIQNEVRQITAESLDELSTLNELYQVSFQKNGLPLEVSLRIQAREMLNHNGRLIAEPSQFGIDLDSLATSLKKFGALNAIRITGFHSHLQSQILNSDHVVQNFKYTLDAFSEADLILKNSPNALALQLRHLNLGGGFGIPYSTQPQFELTKFKSSFEALRRAHPFLQTKSARLQIELGRFIVGEAGSFIAKVLYRKISKGRTYIILNGGFTQCQIACGTGQIVRRNFPVSTVHLDQSDETIEVVTLVGPSCYSQDIVAQDIELPKLEAGDLVRIHNVGAYGHSFSPTSFLRMPLAGEFCLNQTP
jgi:diaminopimelate decarboxylase